MNQESDPRHEILRGLTEYCDGKDCGDPIVTVVSAGPVAYTRRRMDFRGFAFTIVRPPIASYRCPQCGCERTYTVGWVSSRVMLVENKPCSEAHKRA